MASVTDLTDDEPTLPRVIELGCDTRPALALIDKALPTTAARDMIPAVEVQSLLLDIRNAITNN